MYTAQYKQGWEFVHWFFEQIFCERKCDSLFNLSKFEFDSLSQKYKTNDPEYMINYKDFSLTINTAFTQYGI